MQSTREKLIQVAFEAFGRNGFHGVGLDRIIDEAGVSKQTFYNHFESKDELILAVLEHRHAVEKDEFNKSLARLAGDDARDKLLAMFDALHHWYEQPNWHGCIFITAAAEFPMQNDPAHQVALVHLREMQEYIQYLATLAQARDPKALAEELIVLIEGAVGFRHVTGDKRTTEIAKRAAKRLFDEQFATCAVAAS